METSLPLGKLKLEQLRRLLTTYISLNDERVVVGPEVGEDAAVIDMGDRYLVAKTDPITFVADDIGWYAIVINANDLATRGATPKWFLATILLPEHRATEAMVETIFAQLAAACKQYRITLCGGHTEVTYGLDRPIVVGQMLGEVAKDRLIRTAGAQIGNDIILTKGIAVEATSIIARVKHDDLISNYSPDYLRACRDFIYTPGISVVEEARIAAETAQVTSMHDPTEGGVATGLHELAEAAGVGVQITREAIPIFPETATLCARYDLDPLGVIASGALLMTVPPQETAKLLDAFRANRIQASVIGNVVAADHGRCLWNQGNSTPLPMFHQDELTKIFA
ncbi:hydrogenase maturation factor [Candidatus Moduliflexus flocculans]|uniref:Hydrogenase maturation factor n=1 Tax=Candidatus Moduliflexus flocculans TaxID=1499966 RepID=A0A081BTL9_9BACT|nr:hydrogenase maturation factor [Candidatus Moduliflexus flocculans]